MVTKIYMMNFTKIILDILSTLVFFHVQFPIDRFVRCWSHSHIKTLHFSRTSDFTFTQLLTYRPSISIYLSLSDSVKQVTFVFFFRLISLVLNVSGSQRLYQIPTGIPKYVYIYLLLLLDPFQIGISTHGGFSSSASITYFWIAVLVTNGTVKIILIPRLCPFFSFLI